MFLPLSRRILGPLFLSLSRRILGALILSLPRRVLHALILSLLGDIRILWLGFAFFLLRVFLLFRSFLLFHGFFLHDFLRLIFLLSRRSSFFGLLRLGFGFFGFLNNVRLLVFFCRRFFDFRLLGFCGGFFLLQSFLLLLDDALFFGFGARNAHQFRLYTFKSGQMVLHACLKRFHSSDCLL